MDQDLARFTQYLFYATFALAVATGLLVVLGFLQWRQAKQDATESAAQRRATEHSADAAASSAAEAAAANTSARVERITSNLAVVSLARPKLSGALGGARNLRLEISNVSDKPAIQVYVQLSEGAFPWSMSGSTPEEWTAYERSFRVAGEMGILPARGSTVMTAILEASDVPEVMLIRVAFDGILGGQMWQLYEWDTKPEAQAVPEGSGAYAWRLAHMWVISGVEGQPAIGHAGSVG